MKKILALIALCLTGCAALTPGADPLIVRTEQGEAVAKATFDTFEKLDNANRAFFITNAPAMHAFAEYLRAPVVNGGQVLPRGLAFIASLDSVKLSYKNGTATSNALATAIAVLDNAVMQSQVFLSQQQPPTR